jgi:hypothetical protein
MNTLCIIPCGKRKIWDNEPDAGPTNARCVYIGPFAKKCREYAERFYPTSWCILSAKYGFLFPDDIVPETYNVTFKKKSTNPISQDELSNQIIEKELNKFDRIVVLGGKDYVNIIKEVFPKKKIHAPLTNCHGIGDMMGRLNDAIQRGIPL